MIPSNALEISNFAFDGCSNLRKVIFEENSQLKSNGDHAFAFSTIESIAIPAKVSKMARGGLFNAFDSCQELKIIEISDESEFKLLNDLPSDNSLDFIVMIPNKTNIFKVMAHFAYSYLFNNL